MGGFVPWEDFVHGGILSMGGFVPWEDFVHGRILSLRVLVTMNPYHHGMGGFCPWEDFVLGGHYPSFRCHSLVMGGFCTEVNYPYQICVL